MIGALQRRDVPYGVDLEHFVDALTAELSAIGISRQSRAGADG